ncbi:hypothetical protein ACFODZ_10115 [Marinicella sediminis]|uniref:Uncharacterized protein n=1 Tax=Marinicella sediminis TaxID=1792834 RepID=A0ABV7JCL3_9GAMM|nr:hypothetical protein [Marinicella sediminis]
MKKVRNSIITSALVVLAVWLWLNQPKPGKTSGTPHLVTQQTDLATPPLITTQNATKPGSTAHPLTDQAVPVMDDAPIKPEPYSWMAIYRIKRQWQRCGNMIIDLIRQGDDYDPLAKINSYIQNLNTYQPGWPTSQQVNALNRQTHQCRRVIEQVRALPLPLLPVIDEQPYVSNLQQTTEQLAYYLLSLTPEHPHEQAIADSLRLILQWREQVAQVTRISKGSEVPNQTTIDQLRAEQQQLENRLDLIQKALRQQDNNAPLAEEWARIQTRLNLINQQIKALKVINQPQRDEAIAAFQLSHDALNNLLRSRNPDVFFEVQSALEQIGSLRQFGYNPNKFNDRFEFKTPFIEYVSPGEVVQQLIGVENDEWFQRLVHYATRLYHCELGADCGPTGDWIAYHCLTAFTELYANSCDQDLTVFYQQLLSENHWSDVQYTLDVIRGLYAP